MRGTNLRQAGFGLVEERSAGLRAIEPPHNGAGIDERPLDIRVLGPVSVTIGEQSIMPTAGKPRQLLALLALQCPRAVPVSTLMEEIWGEDIPRSGMTTLQTYVLQLRRLISETLPVDSQQTANQVLATQYKGYKLTAAPRSSDLQEFRRLAGDGEAALDRGDAANASKHLGQALELWRGPALADVPTGCLLALDSIGMEESRIRVQERRILANFHLGKHSVLIPELRVLVARNPMHENFAALLMAVFHSSGTTWRALEVFQSLRENLVDRLGVEPSSRLQKLHQAVLSGTPDISLRDYGLT